MGSYYRETRNERGGDTTSKETPALRTHAELDEAATARGHVWTAEGLTVAEKQDELKAVWGE